MKKMWKLNNKAVSPVIATILMVAITVVLAAVLYVMVMGFGGDSNETPSGSLDVEKTGATTWRVTIISIGASDVAVDDVLLTVNGADVTANITWIGAGTYVTAGSYADVTLSTGANTINLLYVPTGNNVASIVENVAA